MGESKRKRLEASGSHLETNGVLGGVGAESPPPGNTGGKGDASPQMKGVGNSGGAESARYRINLSLPREVYQALEICSEKLGAPMAQLALGSLMAGLPALAEQLEAVNRLQRGDESW